jgi:hypothetical protein
MAVTPQQIDTYSRYMDALFDEKQVIGVSTVWQQFYGKSANNGSKTIYSPDSEVADIDIMRGTERIAALIHRGTDSRNLNVQKNTELEKFTSFSRVFPLAEELGDITASKLNKRVGGENPYERRSRMDRMRMLAREHHLEHIRRYVRLFEILAGLSLLGGQHRAISGSTDTNDWYDFCRNAAHIVTPTVPWDVGGGAVILQDWDNALETMRQNGKVWANVAFLGSNVAQLFLTDSVIQSMADIRGFNLIRAGENMFSLPPALNDLVNGGATAIGRVTTPQGHTLYLFTYSDFWEDDNGDFQRYMPANSCFFAYYGARCDRYFGPKELLEDTPQDKAWYQQMFGMNMDAPMMPPNIKNPGAIITPAMFYCDAYRSEDKKKVTIRTQSAPIYATTQTDAFFTYYACLEVSS